MMMAIIEICNSWFFYCSNIVSYQSGYSPTFKANWLQFLSVFISPSTNTLVNDKRKGEMSSSCFLSIKLPSKEFLCLKISCLIGWTIVLRDWVQDLDAFRKILNISCMLKVLQRPVVSAQQNKKTRQAITHTTLFLI